MRRRRVVQILLAGFLLAHEVVGVSDAAIVYRNTFEAGGETISPGVTVVWNNTSRSITPGTEAHPTDTFLGELSNDSVTLFLNNLPPHSGVFAHFDLFLLRSWDGNLLDRDGNWIDYRGPDIFEFSIVDGPVLLHTTIRNVIGGCTKPPVQDPIICTQSYPDDFYPPEQVSRYPPRTGAAESNTLGYYNAVTTTLPQDTVYRMSYSFEHSGPYVTLNFIAEGLQEIGNESWGLDDVMVEVYGTGGDPTPTNPPTLIPTPTSSPAPTYGPSLTPTLAAPAPCEVLFENSLLWYRWRNNQRIDAPEILDLVGRALRKRGE